MVFSRSHALALSRSSFAGLLYLALMQWSQFFLQVTASPEAGALITNDAVVFGLLLTVLALIFYTSSLETPFWKKFYTYVPALLLCYFIPALMTWPLGLISGEDDSLYKIARDYFLPASLILFCLSIDMKSLLALGPKALIM